MANGEYPGTPAACKRCPLRSWQKGPDGKAVFACYANGEDGKHTCAFWNNRIMGEPCSRGRKAMEDAKYGRS